MVSKWTADDIADVFANPIYAGIPPYPALVTDEMWITTASMAIAEHGAEVFLRKMLIALRASMEAARG